MTHKEDQQPMTTREELKPCPFCGGSAQIVEGEESAYVQCLDVKMHRALWFTGDNNAANEVAEQWNTRALTASPGEQEPVAWTDSDVAMFAARMRGMNLMRPKGCGQIEHEKVAKLLAEFPRYTSPPPAAGWNEALRELEAVAEKQKAYFKAKQNEFPCIEDYTGFRGEVSLPDDITPLLKQAEANGRYIEADWWLSTIRESLRRVAPAPEGVDPHRERLCRYCGKAHDLFEWCQEAHDAEAGMPSRPDAGGGDRVKEENNP